MRYLLSVRLIAASLLIASATITGQTPATGVISGVVVDGATNAPLAGVVVALRRLNELPAASPNRQMTDAKGRFVFTDLPPADTYALSTSRFGYFDAGFGCENAYSCPGAIIGLKPGEWFGDARVVMWRPGAVTGAVVDERGEPAVNVYVRVLRQIRAAGHPQLAGGPVVATDDRGIYRIGWLGPGRYIVTVPSRQASVPSGLSAAALSGVSAQMLASYQAGGMFTPIQDALDLTAGARLVIGHVPTLPPPTGNRSLAYPAAFYPNAAAIAQAQVVALGYGDERTGIDLRLEPVLTSRISGVVQGPAAALAGLTLRLLAAGLEDMGAGSEVATTAVAPDGTFTFLNVPAGTYTIDAPIMAGEYVSSLEIGVLPSPPADFSYPPGTPGLVSYVGAESAPTGTQFLGQGGATRAYFGRAIVTVTDHDESELVVTLRHAVTISGHIVVESDPRQKPPDAIRLASVTADPASGTARLGAPRSDYVRDITSEFSVGGLLSGEYFLRTSVTPGTWLVKSVVYGGRDYSDVPFDGSAGSDFSGVTITLTNAIPVLGGVVRNGQGSGVSGAGVIAFPVDPALWTNYGRSPRRIKSTMASSAGSYRLATLPAGEYYLVAVGGSQIDEWKADPEFFAAAERTAVRVAIGWGETKILDLKITDIAHKDGRVSGPAGRR